MKIKTLDARKRILLPSKCQQMLWLNTFKCYIHAMIQIALGFCCKDNISIKKSVFC